MEDKRMFRKWLKGLAFITLHVLGVSYSSAADAQSLELGLFGGGSYYIGELNPAIPFIQTKPAFGVSARYSKSSRWSFRLNYYKGEVSGKDDQFSGVTDRNLSFTTPVNDINVVAEFNFWQYFTGSKNDYVTPYLFAGVGVVMFNPKSTDGVALQPLGTEGQNVGFDGRSPYSRTAFQIPFGMGLKYSLSKRFGLTLEWGMRKTFSDYIDDISTTYYLDGQNIDPANQAQVLSDPTMDHQAWMQRGNSKNFDWLAFAGVTISYKFDMFSKKRCDTLKW